MSIWLIVTSPMCGVAGGLVHSVAFRDLKRGRRTVDAACGRRVKLLTVGVADSDDSAARSWPPRLSTIRDLGYERCRDCPSGGRIDEHYWPRDEPEQTRVAS